MSNCTCGRTTRPPFCDHSHALTDEQYQERTARLMKLRQPPPRKTWIQEVADSVPEHSSHIAREFVSVFENLPASITVIDAHACALTAAIVSGNGELAYEIGMNGPLIGTAEREAAKAAAAEIYDYTIIDRAIDAILDNRVETDSLCYRGNQLYLFAGAVALRDSKHIQNLSSQLSYSVQDQIAIAKICSLTASMGRIAL